MQVSRMPSNEQARLGELARYLVLDGAAEQDDGELDALTALAARLLDVPVVLVSIVDADRQWCKSRHGWALREIPRDVSFCGHVVADEQPLVVPDALADARFADNPLVIGEPRVRFYAGAPLRTPGGFVLGTLCAMDHQPRELAPHERLSLDTLARQVVSQLELRRLRAVERELFEAREESRITLAAITEAVITSAADGAVGYLNAAAEKMTGWSLEEARGKPIDVVMAVQPLVAPGDSPPVLRDDLSGRTEPKGTHVGLLVRRNGVECAVEYSATPLADRLGHARGAVVVSHDVGEVLALANRISHAAHHDALTGLPNRLLLQDRTTQAIETARRKKTRFALLFLDIDDFKHVNDSIGPAAGDELLRNVARRLVGMLRGCDTVCRQGRDEFVLLLQEVTDSQAVARIAEKVLRTLGEPFSVMGQPLLASFSVGASSYPDDGTDFDTLLKASSAAMYRAKTAGQNRYHLASTSTATRAPTRV